MKRVKILIGVYTALCCVMLLAMVTILVLTLSADVSAQTITVQPIPMEPESPKAAVIMYTVQESPVEDVETQQEEFIWTEELKYLAMCVEAEAEDQTELGKRLVCDTVLNRFDSGGYKDYCQVINKKSQYSCVGDGRIFEAKPTEETYRIVREELENRTNTEVLHFRTKHYHEFGTPLFKEDDHYFSKD